jgi:hypothetical protein
MLTKVELFFLHLFRKTVIFTAGLALLVAACGVIYWAYAKYAPDPAPYAKRVEDFRSRLSVAGLVREYFPADSRLVREVDDVFPLPKLFAVEPNWNQSFGDTHQKKINNYLNSLFSVQYKRRGMFETFVFAQDFNFNEKLHDPKAQDERNFWIMYGSLLVAFIDELNTATPKLVELKDSGDYVSSFKKLEEDEYEQTMNWFFNEFREAVAEVDAEYAEREVLRLTSNLGLIVAGSAFAYFTLVMFFFLAASAEIHIRRISDTLEGSQSSE